MGSPYLARYDVIWDKLLLIQIPQTGYEDLILHSAVVATASWSSCESSLKLLQQELHHNAEALQSTFSLPLQLLQLVVALQSTFSLPLQLLQLAVVR